MEEEQEKQSAKVCAAAGWVGFFCKSGNVNSIVLTNPSTFLSFYTSKAFVSSQGALLSVCVFFFLPYFLLWVVQRRIREVQYDQRPAGKCPCCPNLLLLSVLQSL